MLKNKTVEIIKIILSLLLLIPCCSNDSGKIYRTTTGEPILNMYADPKDPTSGTFIMNIPFKSKVEVIDNKSIDKYVKIKYKDTIGYVYEGYLSAKDDIPFIEDVKYNLSIHEFDYDKKSIIETLKKYMLNSKIFYDGIFPYSYKIPHYYIDDPQMFSLYGKDYDGTDIKIVAVIMNSKIVRYDSRIISFMVEDNELIFRANYPVETKGKIVIEEWLEELRYPTCLWKKNVGQYPPN